MQELVLDFKSFFAPSLLAPQPPLGGAKTSFYWLYSPPLGEMPRSGRGGLITNDDLEPPLRGRGKNLGAGGKNLGAGGKK